MIHQEAVALKHLTSLSLLQLRLCKRYRKCLGEWGTCALKGVRDVPHSSWRSGLSVEQNFRMPHVTFAEKFESVRCKLCNMGNIFDYQD